MFPSHQQHRHDAAALILTPPPYRPLCQQRFCQSFQQHHAEHWLAFVQKAAAIKNASNGLMPIALSN
jgi:hypothetical protein